MVRPGILGHGRVDNLLNLWLKEHRMRDLRDADAKSEHKLRDLVALQGVGVRPYKGPQPRGRR